MELLERERHLHHLAELLRHAAAGQGCVVLAGGEAEVGKTALVDAFGRRDGGGAADLLRRALHAGSTRCRARLGPGARPPD